MEEGDGEMRTVVEKLKGQLDMLPRAIIITVQRKDLEMLIHVLEEKTEEWSNQSCLGYVIQGLNDAGLDGAEGRELVRYVQRAVDSKTLKQATSVFRKSRI